MATAPLCTTARTYQISRILLGLFGSPVESLCEISITDIVSRPREYAPKSVRIMSADIRMAVVHARTTQVYGLVWMVPRPDREAGSDDLWVH